MNAIAWFLSVTLLFPSLVWHKRAFSAIDEWETVPIGQVAGRQQAWGRDEPGRAPLFICRAFYAAPGREKGLHLGKIRTDFHGCHISYGGLEQEIPEFQVVRREVVITWIQASGGQIPPGLHYLEGFEGREDGGQRLFVCRTTESSGVGIQLGKIRLPFSGCHYPYGNVERIAGQYELATL